MNIELLRKIQHHITEEPRRLEMGTWITMGLRGLSAPPCGTAACIAGWAKLLTHPKSDRHASDIGIEQLELRDSWEDSRLCYSEHWPAQFQTDYVNAKSHAERARVTCARIDHFIKTDGAQ